MCFPTFYTIQIFSVSYPLIYSRPKMITRTKIRLSCTYLVNSEIYTRSFSIAKLRIVKFFFGHRLYLTENTVYLNYKGQIEWDINMHVCRCSCKLSYVCQILTKIWMSQGNLYKSRIRNFKKIHRVRGGRRRRRFALFHERTQRGDGLTDMTRLVISFPQLPTSAPINNCSPATSSSPYSWTELHCFPNTKNVTCYNQMIVAIVDVLTSFNFFPRSIKSVIFFSMFLLLRC
jgi:hypothetical protein